MPLNLSLESLELFPDYDTLRPETEERIYERMRSMQERYDGRSRHRIFEDANIGVSRMATSEYYPIVRKEFGPRKVFADAGCGMGTDPRKAIKDGIEPERVFGITIKPEEIEWGYELYQDKGNPRHSGQYIVSDLRNLGIESKSVDFLNNTSIIHTFGKKEYVLQFLKESERILKPGGLFFGRTGGDFEERLEPHYRISKNFLERYLHELGFNDIDVKPYVREKPITFKYVSSRDRSDKPKEAPEPVMLHFIARKV